MRRALALFVCGSVLFTLSAAGVDVINPSVVTVTTTINARALESLPTDRNFTWIAQQLPTTKLIWSDEHTTKDYTIDGGPGGVNIYEVTATPSGIAYFPYTEKASNGTEQASFIGRMTPQGQFTKYAIPNTGFFYVPQGGGVGVPDVAFADRKTLIATSPSKGLLLRFDTETGSMSEIPLPRTNLGPTQIIRGYNGKMYVSATMGGSILELNPATLGVNEYRLPSSAGGSKFPYPGGIAQAPDGNIWYATQSATDGNTLGRMTLNGQFLGEIPLPYTSALAERLVMGKDGNLWATLWNSKKLLRLQMPASSSSYRYGAVDLNVFPYDLAPAPAQNGTAFRFSAYDPVLGHDFLVRFQTGPGLGPDLELSKSAVDPFVQRNGQLATFELVVRNKGQFKAENCKIQDQVLSGLQIVTAISPGLTCLSSDLGMSCSIGELQPNESRFVQVRVRVTDQTNIVNAAWVETDVDTDSENNMQVWDNGNVRRHIVRRR